MQSNYQHPTKLLSQEKIVTKEKNGRKMEERNQRKEKYEKDREAEKYKDRNKRIIRLSLNLEINWKLFQKLKSEMLGAKVFKIGSVLLILLEP